MQDVYDVCPMEENDRYRIRLVTEQDCADLLRVYSDSKAVPLFNSDNCHGDDFHYTTKEQMRSAIDFWLFSYKRGYFVRWSVIDKAHDTAIGTIELFRRQAADFFTDCGLLRLDLRSDYENAQEIGQILGLILHHAFDWFGCSMIATKAIAEAAQRRCALESLGFTLCEEKLIGHDGTEYEDYLICAG